MKKHIKNCDLHCKLQKCFRIMKISIFLLFLSINIYASNVSYGQTSSTISVNLHNKTLKEAFAEIENNSEYIFLFNDQQINANKRVSVSMKDATLEKVLASVLEDESLDYKMSGRQIILFSKVKSEEIASKSAGVQQQSQTITGQVFDESGDPLIGVSILEKGTTNGTLTDMDGKFKVLVSSKAVIQISYIGFLSQSVTVSNNLPLKIVLKANPQALDEVIVVGYATVKKENLTGAVDQIGSKVLESRPVMNVAQALQGTMGNLNISSASGGGVGAKQSINIRGYTGFEASGSPLFVIDGVQSTDMDDINPNDIESISVLKDAASSAIYGSSAPYGVIIITTKKGKIGTAPRITYSNSLKFAEPINLPKMVNSLYFVESYNEAYTNAGMTPVIRDETIQRIKDYQAGLITTQTIKRPGVDEWDEFIQGNANYDWFDVHFKGHSFSQQHNIGLSGGSNNSTYYVGMGYNKQDGLYRHAKDSYERYNVRTNLSSEINKWLTFGVRSAFSRGVTNRPNRIYGPDPNDPNKVVDLYMTRLTHKFPNGAMINPDGGYSDYSDITKFRDGGRNKLKEDKMTLTGELVVNPLSGWNITFNYTFDGIYNYDTAHFATVNEKMPSGKEKPIASTIPNSYSVFNQRAENQILNLFTSYEKSIGDHYTKVLVGYTQEARDIRSTTSDTNYLFTDNNPSLNLSYGTNKNGDKMQQLAIRGAFGRLNYGYKEKYLFEFNGRYDGSSKFLKDTRYKFYPGASGAWVASKEDFWKNSILNNAVNTFKLRASYGSLGDHSSIKDWYQFYPSMPSKGPNFTNWIFAGGRDAYLSNPSLINPNLTWVTTTTIDIGVDMVFFDNRLSTTFDWYRRKADDFVGPALALPAILGAPAPQTNNASMETKGFELSVSWRDMIGKDFSYGVKVILSDYQGKILKYPNPTNNLAVWREGQKMGELWGYETYGLFQSQEEIDKAPSQYKLNALPLKPGDVRYVDLDGDGEISYGNNTSDNPGDRKVIGNNTPRYSFGITLNAEYKNFDFSIFMEGIGKRDALMDRGSTLFWGFNGNPWNGTMLTVHTDRWTPENPGGYYPRYYMSSEMNKNTEAQTRYLQNAAYMRIKNMQLGYTIPKAVLSKVNLSNARIFASVENLATFTKFTKVMDPEFATTRGAIYPLQRTWAFGLNVTF